MTEELWRHYKGGLYRVLHEEATIEATGELAVVYQSVNDNRVWVRTLENFAAIVETPDGKRFRFLPEQTGEAE